ncbi:diguanylate cyclase [Sphingomonas sp. CL5.1]|uniref:sensor domain-containing diguanylate cyclase n=1 Tax=Sphingomonas sp. CL5.1 TaxID=2653203 RepID=UPI001581B98C|nr:sensor domain-containing diguanylate cyclase [Sphingomonas sp. CL5.1]QKS01014.1 diguanylate cyclase [Sphingomonas sp. CL5.1]
MGRIRLPLLVGSSLLYVMLAAGTMWLLSDGRGVAPLWPANAVLLAILLQGPRPLWREAILVEVFGNLVASLLMRGAILTPMLFSVANLFEAAIAAIALRRVLSEGEVLGGPGNVGRFIIWAGLVAPLSSMGVGAAVAHWFIGQDLWISARTWFFSNALGLLVFTPFFSSLLAGEYNRLIREMSVSERMNAAAAMAIMTVAAVTVFFYAPRPVPGLLFAPLMLITFKQGRLGTQVAVMIVAVTGMIGAMSAASSFDIYGHTLEGRLHVMQLFLALMLLTTLPVAASLSARARLIEQLAESERRLRAREADLIRLAATDPMTGLLNRAALNERLAAIDDEVGMAIAVLDLDRFKQVNDRYGHDAGDRALMHFARLMATGIRQGDVAARSGGDEFMIYFPATSETDAWTVCKRLADTLSNQPVLLDGDQVLDLRMSCGVAEQRRGETLETVIKRADQALYAAKAAGRSRVLRAAA